MYRDNPDVEVPDFKQDLDLLSLHQVLCFRKLKWLRMHIPPFISLFHWVILLLALIHLENLAEDVLIAKQLNHGVIHIDLASVICDHNATPEPDVTVLKILLSETQNYKFSNGASWPVTVFSKAEGLNVPIRYTTKEECRPMIYSIQNICMKAFCIWILGRKSKKQYLKRLLIDDGEPLEQFSVETDTFFLNAGFMPSSCLLLSTVVRHSYVLLGQIWESWWL